MKNKLWLYQLPFVLICTFGFYVAELGVEGRIENPFLRDKLRPVLMNISTTFTDFKFKLRGHQKPKNNIVIIEVDNQSIETIGRWPWHRNWMALLIEKAFAGGAKVVGLDIVFGEEDVRVSEELEQALVQHNLGHFKQMYETDPILGKTIADNAERLVLGWTPEGHCQPLYDPKEICPFGNPDYPITYPENFQKFAYQQQIPDAFDWMRSPLITVFNSIVNLPSYNEVGRHAGYFLATPDADGVVRRSPMLVMLNGKAYPSLSLEMARVGLGEELKVEFDSEQRVRSVAFAKSGRELPTTPVGAVEMNVRGPGYTYPYLSALDVFSIGEEMEDPGRKLASESAVSKLKDAYVLIGVSALGAFDMRAFTFDKNVPGVEGHATLLDNVLSNDFLTRGSGWTDPRWLYLIMIFGGVLFAFFTQKLEAIPALVLTLASFAGFGIFDLRILFENNINWNTSFLFIEMSMIFIFTVAAKYVMEERNKKFVRGAFAKYVAPAVVDSILKDPAKLTVGGEKRDLTILFSDIRSFTTFSEKMDAKALSSFLNDYLGIMTGIVFANEGTLDKYIGDAIMAFWGAPLDQPKHAANACRAAAQMMQALAENKARFKEQYGVDVDIGIGLNTGVVSVGNMGSSNNFAYTVIGDHVNLASRLEGLTKYYGAGIVTSRFTFDGIHQAGEKPLPHRVLDFVKVKGKKNAVELIQVLEKEYPAEGLRLFEEARRVYRVQKWDEAIALFKKSNEQIMGSSTEMDGPCQMYIERCEELKKNPPGTDWDGTWEMLSK